MWPMQFRPLPSDGFANYARWLRPTWPEVFDSEEIDRRRAMDMSCAAPFAAAYAGTKRLRAIADDIAARRIAALDSRWLGLSLCAADSAMDQE